MPPIRFPYRRFRANPTPAFPHKNQIWVPIIPVVVHHGTEATLPFGFLVDSGADYCLADATLGPLLKLDIKSGVKDCMMAAGQKPLDVWFHNVVMEIEGRRFPVRCAFGALNNPVVAGVLGRDSFFSRFKVTFEDRKRSITLNYREKDLE